MRAFEKGMDWSPCRHRAGAPMVVCPYCDAGTYFGGEEFGPDGRSLELLHCSNPGCGEEFEAHLLGWEAPWQ